MLTGFDSTAWRVVLVLNQLPGLRGKQVFLELKKNKGKTTFQNVHKTLKRLLRIRIVNQKGLEYSLNSKWVNQFKAIASELKAGKRAIK